MKAIRLQSLPCAGARLSDLTNDVSILPNKVLLLGQSKTIRAGMVAPQTLNLQGDGPLDVTITGGRINPA